MAYIIALIVIALDQVSKALIASTLRLGDVVVIAPILSLHHVRNTGAAWSLFANQAYARPLFIAIGLIASLIFVVLARRTRDRLAHVWIGFILGGALGNIIDRIRLGGVVDFVSVSFGRYAFPTFNVADMAVTIGLIGLIVSAMFVRGFADRLSLSRRGAAAPSDERRDG